MKNFIITKIVPAILLMLILRISAGAQQLLASPRYLCNSFAWVVSPNNVVYGEFSTMNLCAAQTYSIMPTCVLDYSLTGMSITLADPNSTPAPGAGITSYPDSLLPIDAVFYVGGLYRFKAAYQTNMRYTDADVPGPHRHSASRTINVKVVDIREASAFSMNTTNLCPSPLTNVTINR